MRTAILIFLALPLTGCTSKYAGLRARAQGDPVTAVRELSEAVRADPDDPVSHLALGLAYRDLADAALAEQHLARAVKLDPRDRNAHRYLALTREQLGWQMRAAQTWDEIITAYPGDRLTPAFKDHAARLKAESSGLTQEAAVNRVDALREKGLLDENNLPRSIVVLPIQGPREHPDYALLGNTLSRMLAADLSRLDILWVIGPDQALRRMRLMGVDWDPDDLTGSIKEAGKALGAGVVIGGFLRKGFEEEIRADIVVADPEPFARLLDARTESTRKRFFELEREVVDKVLNTLGLLPNERERARFGRFATTSAEALAHHLEGVGRYRTYDMEAALADLQRAVEIDPGFPCPHRAIARIYALQGRSVHAARALRQGHGRGNPRCVTDVELLGARILLDRLVADLLRTDLEQGRAAMRNGVQLLFTRRSALVDRFVLEGASASGSQPVDTLPAGWVWGAGRSGAPGLADPSSLGGLPASGLSTPDPATSGAGGAASGD